MAKKKKADIVATPKAAPKSRGKRKLADEQVAYIASAYKGRGKGPTMAALAAEYGIATGTVSAILKGRTYAWLTGIGVEAPLAQAA